MSMVLYIPVGHDLWCLHHRRGGACPVSTKRESPIPVSKYTYGVGFGIAYPRLEGNAKAYRSGMSDEFRFPRFFVNKSCLGIEDKKQ